MVMRLPGGKVYTNGEKRFPGMSSGLLDSGKGGFHWADKGFLWAGPVFFNKGELRAFFVMGLFTLGVIYLL